MPLTLILPAAGKSSRFTTRPKYMLTAPNGNLMLMEALFNIDLQNVDNIIIVLVKEHVDKFSLNLDVLAKSISDKTGICPSFHILDDFTSSQSETVYQTLVHNNITGGFCIKDCDNIFKTIIEYGNYVCTSKLTGDTNAVNKSYLNFNKFGKVSGIIEKQVIGDVFCVGGYSFAEPSQFKSAYEYLLKIKDVTNSEIYISHIIQYMLLSNINFDNHPVEEYVDLGTEKDWTNYCKKFSTLFIDLDGTLCEQSSEFFKPSWGQSDGITKNIELLNELFNNGKTTIIITTSRKIEYAQDTENQLKLLGIKYHQILFGLPHAKRILVNDFAPTNPYPSAIAINLRRGDDNLKDLLVK